MAINLNTIATSGSLLLWLGLIVSVISIAFFIAVSTGISDGFPQNLHLHDTYYVLIEWRQRLIFLLPVVAGIILVISGLIIRNKIPTWQTGFEDVKYSMGSEESAADDHEDHE